ncbi:hypothetical protein OIU76_026607 [Salix suchowensis]|uniref:MYB transcription factor n=3 Tax=Salix TaxID=40685 RepID=A0A9Q1A6C8_9ROSI|nr:DNA-binding family protein [Salix suchowensis]KAJ6295765.1 hypothetical protein OIU78_023740 [Salix suchowensis]KAJ6372148.1 hypothetical protein OIU76_026607 [Salix suchowensis]KAJ6759582.1 SINGLE MYB HISTONE 4 [Salix koriyanagi]
MGNPKQKWTSEEEEALRAGVAKHGTGKWKNIQRDPEFNPYLYSRSNIDLKDKWRNMTVSAGSQSVKDKSRTLKARPNPDAAAHVAASTPLSNPHSSAAADDVVFDDSSEAAADSKTAPKYNAMIFEAISALNEPNGADTSAIISYIERRQELPQNFRRQLSSRLRRLLAQEKLEKVQNCYKIKKSSSFGTKTPTPKQKEMRPKPVQNIDHINSGDTVTEAADDAAYMVAEAENKSFVATEAVKESERVSKMAEDANSLLQLANEILEKCKFILLLQSLLFHFILICVLIHTSAGSRGEIVVMG